MAEPNLTSQDVDAPFQAEAVAWSGFSWEEARAAIERHEQGSFWISAQLATQAKRYPPVRAAAKQRRASPEGLPWSVEGPERRPGLLETEAARALWKGHIARLLTSMLDDIAFLGLSVLKHPTAVDAEGRRYVVSVDRWPLGAVGYSTDGQIDGISGYYALARDGTYHQLPRPGETDGFWTVVASGDRPHLDGAITSLDVQYVAGAIAERARANLIATAGRTAPTYEMPEDTPTDSAEGRAAKATLAGLGTKKAAALFPHGGKLDKFELGSQTYAFFESALRDRIQMVELALLCRAGTTAKPDAQYQPSQGIEISVPEDLVRADVTTIERSISSLFALLARLNGDIPSERAPRLAGNLPDTDQAAKVEAEQAQRKADDEHTAARLDAAAKLAAAIKAERDAGLVVDAARVAELAELAGVPAPRLPEGAPKQAQEIFAYHLSSGSITRGAVAAQFGWPAPPMPHMTEPEFQAWVARQAAVPAPEAPPAAPAASPPVPATPPAAPEPAGAA